MKVGNLLKTELNKMFDGDTIKVIWHGTEHKRTVKQFKKSSMKDLEIYKYEPDEFLRIPVVYVRKRETQWDRIIAKHARR